MFMFVLAALCTARWGSRAALPCSRLCRSRRTVALETPTLCCSTRHRSPRHCMTLFPGVPDSWHDVGFHQLRAANALLVSANRTNGSALFVRLLIEKRGPVRLHVHDPAWETPTPPASTPRSVQVAVASGGRAGEWTIELQQGQLVVLHMGRAAPELVILPLAGNASEFNHWGYKNLVADAPSAIKLKGVNYGCLCSCLPCNGRTII